MPRVGLLQRLLECLLGDVLVRLLQLLAPLFAIDGQHLRKRVLRLAALLVGFVYGHHLRDGVHYHILRKLRLLHARPPLCERRVNPERGESRDGRRSVGQGIFRRLEGLAERLLEGLIGAARAECVVVLLRPRRCCADEPIEHTIATQGGGEAGLGPVGHATVVGEGSRRPGREGLQHARGQRLVLHVAEAERAGVRSANGVGFVGGRAFEGAILRSEHVGLEGCDLRL
mmetsp:Transcript_52759/g.152084  ORF Transcript_52759/g.152084 Transcript_52759/m.152084 type:complete len:229 (-) Transcript_52759:153-839(-)